ncbi:MAG: FMN-binding protein [Candidatus Nanopelagicales bacterium]
MKRALVVTAGTVAGVAAVLALNPSTSTVAAKPGGTGATTPGGGSGSGSGGTQTATGDAIDVRWGNVQVQVTLTGSRITDIASVQLPDGDGHSARISERVWPTLVQQAIEAQSSQIAGVSGASYTSYGFEQSLKSALLALGHAP